MNKPEYESASELTECLYRDASIRCHSRRLLSGIQNLNSLINAVCYGCPIKNIGHDRLKKSAGFTLVELLVTVIVSSIFFMIVGQLLITSFQQNLQASERMEVENNLRYFRCSFEYLYRSATNDPVTIIKGPPDTIQFAAQTPTGGLTQNQFSIVNGNVVRTYNSAQYVGGVLTATSGPMTQIMLPNATSLVINSGSGAQFASPTLTISIDVGCARQLSGGALYTRQISFFTENWNQRL